MLTFDDIKNAIGDDVPEADRDRIAQRVWEQALAGQAFRDSHPDPAIRLASAPILVFPPVVVVAGEAAAPQAGSTPTPAPAPAAGPVATPSTAPAPVQPVTTVPVRAVTTSTPDTRAEAAQPITTQPPIGV